MEDSSSSIGIAEEDSSEKDSCSIKIAEMTAAVVWESREEDSRSKGITEWRT